MFDNQGYPPSPQRRLDQMTDTESRYCQRCNYQGYSPSGFCMLSRGELECPECEGAGVHWEEGPDGYNTEWDCEECDGSGSVECDHGYEGDVWRHLEGVEFLSVGHCAECECCPEEPDAGAGFSWRACESCGSTLGGDRHPAHGIVGDEGERELAHFDVCTDCVFYHAYGDIPERDEA